VVKEVTTRILKKALAASDPAIEQATEEREFALSMLLGHPTPENYPGGMTEAQMHEIIAERIKKLREADQALVAAISPYGTLTPEQDAEIEEFLASVKAEALLIDPTTAEIRWEYGQTMDPYGVDPDLPDYMQQVQRNRFARRPGSDIWVWFGDLPSSVVDALYERDPAESERISRESEPFHAARNLDDYMRFRAEKEGVEYKLSRQFFLDNPAESYFGVYVEDRGPVRDEQNPEAFEAWHQKVYGRSVAEADAGRKLLEEYRRNAEVCTRVEREKRIAQIKNAGAA
jgi:hypothetical protein